MDDARFDALTKRLNAPTRRSLVAAAGGAVLAAFMGRDAADEALAKKKKGKKKKSCKGQRCGEKCIPARACCTSARQGRWVAEGATVGQCGLCLSGKITKDPVDCLLIDETGCTVCNDSYECVPAPDGTLCEGCGTCNGGLCEDPDETRQCGEACCSGPNPFCVDETAGLCCAAERACDSECCKPDSGFGLEDGEICTRDGCCLEVKAANNCRADHPTGTPCTEKICCDHIWTQEGRGLACPPGAGVAPDTRGYCCGPGKKCCFTGCCPADMTCCGDGTCCPPLGCGGEGCIAPVPDHI